MQTRRNDYRHAFAPGEGPTVSLGAAVRPEPAAEVVNLSVGGLRLRCDGAAGLPAPGSRTVARLALAEGQPPLHLSCVVVYAGDGCCGLRFLPLACPVAQDTREKQLWRFLLNEQWRARRERAG